MIDPRAIIHPTATLGANVQVGAWSVIGEQVALGDDAIVTTHVVIQAGTRVGARCQIGPHAVIGADPLAPASLSDLPGTALPQAESATLTLGDDSVVCALARVVTSVAARATVAGNPAVTVSASAD